MWNWNYHWKHFFGFWSIGINHTNVELKSLIGLLPDFRSTQRINHTNVELKFCFQFYVRLNRQRINHTNVELKSLISVFLILVTSGLIIPMWNWNLDACNHNSAGICIGINHTNVELKLCNIVNISNFS